MVVEIQKAVDVFQDLAKIPILVSGKVSSRKDGIYQISSLWNQRDLERNEKINSYRYDTVRLADGKVETLMTSHQYEASNELYNVTSPSGELTAIIRKVKSSDAAGGKKDGHKIFIEIWKDDFKWKNIDTDNVEQHGKIYGDDAQFGSLRWSHKSDKLLYIAEKKETKAKSWFDKKTEKGSEGKKEDVRVGEEYLYEEDWGERLVDKRRPVVCTLDVSTETVAVLDIDPQLSAGTPIWTSADDGVIFAAWNHEPRRLGIMYCPIRKSGIYHHDLITNITTKLSGDDVGVMSPVLSPDGAHVLWVQVREGGPHIQTCKLMMTCLKDTTKVWSVVDVVDTYTPAKHAENVFPGLYQIRLPDRCWSSDHRLILDNPWRFSSELMAVDVNNGHVTKLTHEKEACSWSVLDVDGDLILAARSSHTRSAHLLLGQLKGDQVTWTELTSGRTFSDLQYKVQVHGIPQNRLSPEFPSVTEFESLLLSPVGVSTSNKIPLVLYPHGGPHSRFTASFMYFAVGFAQCGFAVLMVNYRGSAGYGQDFLWCLPGHVGDMDVKDCMQALEDTLASGFYDERRLCVTGGSHGGLLTCSLIGQYPDTFRVAVANNPVVNMTSMFHVTDIPDWVLVETLQKTGDKFDAQYVPTPADYDKFHQASPLSYVDKVKTPLMLMLGKADRRVPCVQGEEYYRVLKARGVPTRAHHYPESGHALQEVNVEADTFVNSVLWFTKHI